MEKLLVGVVLDCVWVCFQCRAEHSVLFFPVIEQGYVCFRNFQSLLNVLGYASHIKQTLEISKTYIPLLNRFPDTAAAAEVSFIARKESN